MKFSRLFLISLLCVPVSLFASSGMVDSQATLSQLTLLVTQYEARIKQLEAENSVLKTEMVKAGIKIPLSDYSGAITAPIPTSLSVSSQPSSSGVIVSSSGGSSVSLSGYSPDVTGFIARIQKDWSAIKSAYSLPQTARLAGYEFVLTGSQDHVFADISVESGATNGVYDIKILYQYEKTEFKRRLIGIFDYSPSTQRYTTRTGSNPFGGVPRKFVPDPSYTGKVVTPSTAISSGGVPVSTGSSLSGSTLVSSSGALISSVTFEDINKAYSEKKYLSTISLSNAYLTSHAPTFELLSIRYRTFFIIGKYTESLAEIGKIETLGALDRQTACNAQVIATYSNNQSLISKYTTICKK